MVNNSGVDTGCGY